jgi:hypothetical protein
MAPASVSGSSGDHSPKMSSASGESKRPAESSASKTNGSSELGSGSVRGRFDGRSSSSSSRERLVRKSPAAIACSMADIAFAISRKRNSPSS